jgi:hypothetical protein
MLNHALFQMSHSVGHFVRIFVDQLVNRYGLSLKYLLSKYSNDAMNFVNVQSNNAKHRGLVCYTITNYLSNFICATSGPE